MSKFFCALALAVIAAMGSTALAGTRLADIVTFEKYDMMFPERVAFYSYDGFVRGGAATVGFCTTGDTPTRIRECAAFLANAAHETGNGRFIVEHDRPTCPKDYCDYTQKGPCAPAPGQAYYGRGWMQISWNYNYCAASKFIYRDDGHTLAQDPGILERDPEKATQASLWYWMTQESAGTMSAHDCMTTGQGFGCTIRAINGALECDGGPGKAEVKSREALYLRFLTILGDGELEPVGPNGC